MKKRFYDAELFHLMRYYAKHHLNGKEALTLLRENNHKIRTATFYEYYRKINPKIIVKKHKIVIPKEFVKIKGVKSKRVFTIEVTLVNLKNGRLALNTVEVFHAQKTVAKKRAIKISEDEFNRQGGSPYWKGIKATILIVSVF